MARYDVIGNIVIVKFSRDEKLSEKKKFALAFLKKHKKVTTVVEKAGKFSGRLRTQKTNWIAGEKTKEALCKENGCVFRLNIDTCYFSPRMSSERKDIAEKVKRKEEVLVMFGGIGVYAIVIGRISICKKVVSVELGRDCNKYALKNVKRNKMEQRVEIVGGDVRKVLLGREKYDRVIMARPNLKDSFLDIGFRKIKKNGVIHYYGFTENRKFSVSKTPKGKKRVIDHEEKDKRELKDLVLNEARKARKKIRILKFKKAGEVGVRKFRYRVDVKVS